MDPKKWGKYHWGMIYCVIINYPDNPTIEDKKTMMELFKLLQSLLPCENCRHHYGTYLVKYPLTENILSSRSKLLDWTININNEINRRLGKKEYSAEEVINYYTKPYQNNNSQYITIFLFVALIILLICYIKLK